MKVLTESNFAGGWHWKSTWRLGKLDAGWRLGVLAKLGTDKFTFTDEDKSEPLENNRQNPL